ncbi:MAG: hypothetical protein ACYDC5_02850 [Candidatus Dormibacteria bacterium]
MAEYVAPTTPVGSELDVIERAGGCTATVNCAHAVSALGVVESVAWTVKVKVPVVVGVPWMSPPVVRVSPARLTPVSECGERDGSCTWDEAMGRTATETAANAWGAGPLLLLVLEVRPRSAPYRLGCS